MTNQQFSNLIIIDPSVTKHNNLPLNKPDLQWYKALFECLHQNITSLQKLVIIWKEETKQDDNALLLSGQFDKKQAELISGKTTPMQVAQHFLQKCQNIKGKSLILINTTYSLFPDIFYSPKYWQMTADVIKNLDIISSKHKDMQILFLQGKAYTHYCWEYVLGKNNPRFIYIADKSPSQFATEITKMSIQKDDEQQ